MKLLSKLNLSVSRIGLVSVAVTLAFVSLNGMLAPIVASAQMGGGGPTALTAVDTAAPASGVKRVGYSITPKNTLGATDNISLATIGAADTLSYVSFSWDGTTLNVYCSYTGHTGNYVTGDYVAAGSGVTLNTGSTSCGFSYPVAAVANKTYIVTLDYNTAGEIDVMFKNDVAAEVTLTGFLIGGAVTAPPKVEMNLYRGGADCVSMPATQMDVQALFDDVAVAGILTKDASTCANFDTSTYDANTKVASINWLAGSTSGIAVNHQVTTSGQTSTLNPVTTLNSAVGTGTIKNVYFTNSLTSSSSASQQVYLTHSSDGTDGFTKFDSYPIAGGIFDLSEKNVDLVSVTSGSDLSKHAAFVHGLGALTKDGTFSLFIPFKTGDNFVGICGGATSLDSLGSKCTGIYYLKDGQTKTNKDTKSIAAGHSVKATTLIAGGVKYWQVDGLTGTGGFSTTLASDPDTGLSVKTTSLPAVIAVMMATIGVAILARRASAKK